MHLYESLAVLASDWRKTGHPSAEYPAIGEILKWAKHTLSENGAIDDKNLLPEFNRLTYKSLARTIQHFGLTVETGSTATSQLHPRRRAIGSFCSRTAEAVEILTSELKKPPRSVFDTTWSKANVPQTISQGSNPTYHFQASIPG